MLTPYDIKIVNVRSDRSPTVYLGRKMPGWDGSPLANRHPVGKVCPICKVTHQRGETLRMYHDWLLAEMESGKGPAHDEVHRIADLVRNGAAVTLGCWCWPEPCHAELVREFVVGVLGMPKPQRERRPVFVPAPEADDVFRLIVFGSHKGYSDRAFVEQELKRVQKALARKGKRLVIVSGLAAGPDTWGKEWGEANGVDVDPHRADWLTHGLAAGPIRNSEMEAVADGGLGFWNGISRGTIDMAEKLKAAGKPVLLYGMDRQMVDLQPDPLKGVKVRKGNMFEHLAECTMLLVTTNSFITTSRELVMGRGAAADAKAKWPTLPTQLGTRICAKWGHMSEYNLAGGFKMQVDETHSVSVAAFQVKYHFKDVANLGLIERSANKLREYALQHPEQVIFCNFPGIGNGKVKPEFVAPMLQNMPANVTFWMLE